MEKEQHFEMLVCKFVSAWDHDLSTNVVVVFNTDYGSSEPLKTLVMLCYVNAE